MTNDTNRIISKLLSLIDVTCCHYSLIVYNPTTGTVRGSKDTVSKTDMALPSQRLLSVEGNNKWINKGL